MKLLRWKLSQLIVKLLIKVGWIKVTTIQVDKDIQSILDVVKQFKPGPRNRFVINIPPVVQESLTIPDYVWMQGQDKIKGKDIVGVSIITINDPGKRL